MKHKILNLITLILSVVIAMIVCVSCQESGETKAMLQSETETQIVMKIEETDGKANAFDALKSLRNQDALSFDYTSSQYGAYITSINGKAEAVTESTMNSSKGYSWMLYTSDMDNAYTTETITVGETTCGKAAQGASSLTVKAGALYVWVYESYEYSW